MSWETEVAKFLAEKAISRAVEKPSRLSGFKPALQESAKEFGYFATLQWGKASQCNSRKRVLIDKALKGFLED